MVCRHIHIHTDSTCCLFAYLDLDTHSKCGSAGVQNPGHRQLFLLPQRRNRVWGLAAVAGTSEVDKMEDNFSRALDDMSTRVKLPAEEIFEKGLPQVDPPEGRQAQLVERAKNVFGSDDIFVDTSTSLKRLYAKVGGAPCITPEHPIYSTKLKRFLTPAEFLSAQGLFKSCFKDSVWQQMVTVPKFGQDLAGNSFSSTVCQGAVLSSMAACPELWLKASGNLPGEKAKDHKRKLAPTEDHLEPPLQKARTGNSRQEGADPSQFLKRITKKRPAPEYDHFVQDHPRRKKDPKGRAKRKYKRKTDGVDGRKFSKGKKDTLSIWSKMQMLLCQLRTGCPTHVYCYYIVIKYFLYKLI